MRGGHCILAEGGQEVATHFLHVVDVIRQLWGHHLPLLV